MKKNVTTNTNTNTNNFNSEKTVTEYFNDEYKEYSFNIIENRAIGSVIDSFKPSTRKVIFVADNNIRKEYNTVETLAGKVVSEAAYHHGSISAEGVIVNATAKYKQSLPLLAGIGNFGSLKSPIASSSRYIKVKLDECFDLIFKDNELLEYKEEDGIKIEPNYYLPTIPLILLNSVSGIAIGYATNILNREPKQIIKDCISYLKGNKLSNMKPYINTFIGDFIQDSENHKKWYIKGLYEIENSTTIRVTELPPSMTYEKFEEHLDSLYDKKLITNWENHGKKDINYIVKLSRESLSAMNDIDIHKLLKLTEPVTENFTVLDEFGKLKIFDSAEEILKYFVDFRLSYYQKRKDYLLNKIKDDIFKMENRALFIKSVIENKIIINNKKKDDIVKDIEKVKIEKVNDSYDYLLSMSIFSLTKEKWDELQKSIKDKKAEEKEIKTSIPKETYISELEELLKKLK